MSIWKNGKLIAGGSQALPLLSFMWADHQFNHPSWLRANTFSWQYGSIYQAAYTHLANDFVQEVSAIVIYNTEEQTTETATRAPSYDRKHNGVQYYGWMYGGGFGFLVLTDTLNPTTSSTVYQIQFRPSIWNITSVIDNAQSETIGGITVKFYLAADGHKICLPDQETNVAAIYNATGVAWYYILDTANQRFKLPRTKKPETNFIPDFANQQDVAMPFTAPRDGWFIAHSSNVSTVVYVNGVSVAQGDWWNGRWSGNLNCQIIVKKGDVVTGAAGTMRFIPFVKPDYNNKNENKYLYFYVGQFTQTALENTAGLNAELFNGKVDVGHQVIAFQAPTAENNYTWYRKYADGWVEQGCCLEQNVSSNGNTFALPIPMADSYYSATITPVSAGGDGIGMSIVSRTQTTITFKNKNYGSSNTFPAIWQVSGMAA